MNTINFKTYILLLFTLLFSVETLTAQNSKENVKSKVKTEANFKSEDAFILHEGTKVTVLDTIENWKKIKLSNGKSGWILKNDIKSL